MVLSLFNPFLSLQHHFINHTRKSIPLLHIDFPCLITNCKRKRKKDPVKYRFYFPILALAVFCQFSNFNRYMFISSEYKQWQKCFEQWLMCCNTCSIKVTLSNENIHLNVLVYLWKTRSNPQKIAMLHYSPGYLQQR